MQTTPNWNDLSHQQKIDLLKSESDADIAARWRPVDVEEREFLQQLSRDRSFWNPDNLDKIETEGRVPSKEITIGAARDLTRGEALLELIDNSIDAWLRRHSKYPKRTARPLQIYIDIDENSQTLSYEDNAGGISRD